MHKTNSIQSEYSSTSLKFTFIYSLRLNTSNKMIKAVVCFVVALVLLAFSTVSPVSAARQRRRLRDDSSYFADPSGVCACLSQCVTFNSTPEVCFTRGTGQCRVSMDCTRAWGSMSTYTMGSGYVSGKSLCC